MKTKLGLRILLTSIALVTIAICTMVLSGLMDRPKKGGGNNGISLEAPFFISTAEAGKAAIAFPINEAGITAYVKVSTINIEKITPIFTELEKVGDNYIVGVTPISRIVVHLYADTDGWLVAYLKTGEPAATIIQWDKYGGGVQSTALEDALYKAGSAANVEIIPENIKYYHFKYPEASNMMLLVKKGGFMQVELPATYALYEASYYTDNYSSAFDISFKTGTLLKIECSGTYYNTKAIMLIYKVQ